MKTFVCVAVALIFISSVLCRDLNSMKTVHITKGEDAYPNSAPYMVLLKHLEDDAHICGGTIIAKEWIVTAANCITEPVGIIVMAGSHKHTKFTQERIVDFGRIHEQYTQKGVGPYDIALLHVSKPFEYTRYVQPALLPALKEIPTGNATLYGWGQTSAYVPIKPTTLQSVQAHIMNLEDCKAEFYEKALIAESNICVNFYDTGVSACKGDSGSPLVKENEALPAELIGIVSWSQLPCGIVDKPTVFTRVSAYIDWITKIQYAYYTLFSADI